MRTSESEARAARRGRQRAREMRAASDAAARFSRRCHVMPAVPDKDERLLQWVYRRSLTTTEPDTWRLRRINAKALRLNIEQSEQEAEEAAVEAVRVAKLKQKQDHIVPRLKGYIVISSSSSFDDDDNDGSDDDPPPTADAYISVGDRKGKRLARKW